MARKPMGMGLILIGAILMTLGSIGVIATITGDWTGPTIDGTYPAGTLERPNPLSLNSTIDIRLMTTSTDVDRTKTTCIINNPNIPPPGITVGLSVIEESGSQIYFGAPYTIDYEGRYTFSFYLWDKAGNKTLLNTYGEVGDADGNFYLKDGNDGDYTLVTKDASVIFNHPDIYFKFMATSHGSDITRVWVDVLGQTSFELDEVVANSQWNGHIWTMPAEASYTVYGNFTAFGREFRGLSIVVNPTSPTEFPLLTIFSVGLIAIGLVMITTGSATSKKKRR